MEIDDKIPECVRCGCLGNSSCGHEPLNEKFGCALNRSGICYCCIEKEAKNEIHEDNG